MFSSPEITPTNRPSRRRAEKLLGRELDIPTGDGGILASGLVEMPAEKAFNVGFAYKEDGDQA